MRNIPAAMVHETGIANRDGAVARIDSARQDLSTLIKIFADSARSGPRLENAISHLEGLSIEIIKRSDRLAPRPSVNCLVNQPHPRQIERAFAHRLIVKSRAADRHQLALPRHRQSRPCRLNHLTPPVDAHRPQARTQKSRSTTN